MDRLQQQLKETHEEAIEEMNITRSRHIEEIGTMQDELDKVKAELEELQRAKKKEQEE